MNDDEIKNQEHIKKTYIDKASNLLKLSIGISIFSVITYFISMLLYDIFDFGLFFELLSLICSILAAEKIKHNSLTSIKPCIIISITSILVLLGYDLITSILFEGGIFVFSAILFETSGYITWYSLSFLLMAITIFLLGKAYASISKVDGSVKNNDYVDTFYDKL